MTYLLTLSATELARRIRERRLTSREVVEAHLARLERVNPSIRAVVATRFDEAREEAAHADELVRSRPSEQLPPLLGVPCTIKESIAVRGMPYTSGLVARKGVVADRDAPSVARLKEAGAIPLGVTNTSELCMWMETSNRVYGRTNNPYDLDRIAGGSSGGEGAVVASGASPFGIGADIGGSIRLPAFFNGVFGHKPSVGLVPNTGNFPAPEKDARRLLATGPIARRAEDLVTVLRIIAGPDGEDPIATPMSLGDPSAVDLSSLRVVSVEGDGRTPISPELRGAQARVALHLERCGARVETVSIAGFRHALEIWSARMNTAASTRFGVLLGNGEPVRVGRELFRWALGRSPHTLPALGLTAIETVLELFPGLAERMLALGRELQEEVVDRIGEGIMLYPTYPKPAPRHSEPLLPPLRWVYTALFNALELPVTQVPLGLGRHGLPLGIQVAANHGNDASCLAVALELERAFGGWVMPRLKYPARAA